MSGYDRALSVFSPDGHVFQVEYALEAVKRGTCAVGIKGESVVVIGCEKRSALKLQDVRTTPSKICKIDSHITLCFSGLHADARILVDKARIETQSHRLTMEDPASVEYLTKYVAGVKQRYTQSGGVRPFGNCALVAGFDKGSRVPNLFLTEPSGIYSAWKAAAIGRSHKTVDEFLVRNYKEGMTKDETIKLVVKALLEVVQTGPSNFEVAVMEPGQPLAMISKADLEKVSKTVMDEKQEEAASKRGGGLSGAASGAQSQTVS